MVLVAMVGYFLSIRKRKSMGCKLFSLVLASNLLFALLLEICLIGVSAASAKIQEQYEDNEFAEFEMDDDEGVLPGNKAPDPTPKPTPKPPESEELPKDSSIDDSETTIEDDDEEFETVFEDEDIKEDKNGKKSSKRGGGKKPDLKFTNVPLHLQGNWGSYYLEFLMITGLVVFFINFFIGRSKNDKLASTWFSVHRELLEANFALVGDDGKKEIENPGLNKETESVYTLWCSGRVCVEGMLVELRFLKRQDIVSLITRMIKPAVDQIVVRVNLSAGAMDNFVFCIANKKTALRLSKEMNDIITYCPIRKSPEKYGLSENSYALMNEIGEVASFLLDSKVVSLLKKYENCIDYLHFSDQYSGTKLADDTQVAVKPTDGNEIKKVMIFAFNFPENGANTLGERIESMKPLMQLVFYCIDKVKRCKLSKEGKLKADKNRQRVEEAYLKSIHSQRQEMAQLKREERKRAEKERIEKEDDVEKLRKWEEKEYKREMKRKAPKMKQLKVKAM